MRTRGDIDEVSFVLQGWRIQNLSYEYKLMKDGFTKFVYVDSFKELKDKIAEFSLELIQEYY